VSARPLMMFVCDAPGCKSTCTLTNPDDLRDPGGSLEIRGWDYEETDAGVTSLCPAHARADATPDAE
jgi:hypothetical protein